MTPAAMTPAPLPTTPPAPPASAPMSRQLSDALAAPVVRIYWLMLLAGLVVFAALRLDEPGLIPPLWFGAAGGTLLGLGLAKRGFRLWIAGVVIAGVALLLLRMIPDAPAWRTFVLVLVPAALCGYWSLGERSVLAACWFPVVVWMLSILDRSDASLAPDALGAALLVVLAGLFVALLRAREARRVALWRTVSSQPIARARPVEVLRTPPHSQLARAAWGLSVSAITVAVTAWIAPALWTVEPTELDPRARAFQIARRGLPCCPVDPDLAQEGARIKEYLDLGRSHGRWAERPRVGIECRLCDWTPRHGGVVVLGEEDGGRYDRFRPATPATPATPGDHRGVGGGAPVVAPPVAMPNVRPEPGRAVPPMLPPVAAPEPPVTPPPDDALRPPRPYVPSPRAAPPRAPEAEITDEPVAAPQVRPSPAGPPLLRWLLVLGTAALVFQVVALALRPLRRLITLRHLRRPFWDETVAQRVSNAWQLALVGLRDAGWRPGASEAPHELARRVGVAPLADCATVLERARHGVAIDAGDLAAIQASADAAYREARRELGAAARAVGWLRWPLT